MILEKKKVLFLDRDGTICYDDGAFGSEKYSYFEVMNRQRQIEGVKESLKEVKKKGYLLVVISNQAGICKGRFDEWCTHYSNKTLNEKLDNIIDGFYYCPHHETGFNNDGKLSEKARKNLIYVCECRKPRTGMFLKFENDLKNGKIQYIDEYILENKITYLEDREKIFKKEITPFLIDKENSYMIGDKWIDVSAGEKYGVKSIFVMTGEGKVEFSEKKEKFIREYGDLPTKYDKYNDINEFIKNLLRKEF